MAKARSPSYPVIGLREAIEKATAVYGKDYQNPIPRLVAVQHMGYNGLNGKSLGVLSALIKYSLLDGRGDDTRISDLAVQIIAHAPGSPDRAQAIKIAASEPSLFGELDSRFQSGKVSDQAIRSYLQTMKFIPSAAEIATRSYRETKLLVEEETKGYNTEESHSGQSVMSTTTSITSGTGNLYAGPSTVNAAGTVNREIANIRVSKDCAIRLLADGPYSKRSIEALVKNLELQLSLGTYDEQEPLLE